MADLPDKKSARGISAAILSMAEALDLKVIAEGTETEAQVTWLSGHGVHYLQGYHFSKPIPKYDFVKIFAQGRS